LALSRRSFIKAAGAAAGAILVSFGLQNATVDVISAKYIPGAGHPETETEFEEDKVYNERIDKIDTQAFLAACSRCGVCIQKCPFNAIKSKSLAVPQLTEVTVRKCPGYENCGILVGRTLREGGTPAEDLIIYLKNFFIYYFRLLIKL